MGISSNHNSLYSSNPFSKYFPLSSICHHLMLGSKCLRGDGLGLLQNLLTKRRDLTPAPLTCPPRTAPAFFRAAPERGGSSQSEQTGRTFGAPWEAGVEARSAAGRAYRSRARAPGLRLSSASSPRAVDGLSVHSSYFWARQQRNEPTTRRINTSWYFPRTRKVGRTYFISYYSLRIKSRKFLIETRFHSCGGPGTVRGF